MKILTAFCLLFLTNAYLDAADPTVHRRESRDIKNEVFAYASTTYKHEDRELTHLEKETFDLLKKKFPNGLLNKNLETLRELSDTTFLKWLYDAVDVDAKLHERWRRLDGKHEDRELTPLEQETFDLLKKRFPGELLDKDLKTLRAIAESPEYMDGFLPKVYPGFAPFIDFDDFDRTVMPPKERYLGFCREYLNIEKASEITDDEQYVVHHIATSAWANEASQRGGDDPPNEQKDKPFRLGQVMAFKPIGRNILERRSADPAAFAFVLLTSREHLNEDIRWIKTLFEKHGISDGCLHIALQDPILFYRILYAFSTNTSFLKCLYDPVGVETEHQK